MGSINWREHSISSNCVDCADNSIQHFLHWALHVSIKRMGSCKKYIHEGRVKWTFNDGRCVLPSLLSLLYCLRYREPLNYNLYQFDYNARMGHL